MNKQYKVPLSATPQEVDYKALLDHERQVTQASIACREDVRKILSSLWKYVDNQLDIMSASSDWLDGDCSQSAACRRLGRALELLSFDLDESDEPFECDGTVNAALKNILELTQDQELPLCEIHGSNDNTNDSLADQLLEFQSCMITLLIQGRFRDAIDLAHILVACCRVRNEMHMKDLLKAGERKRLGTELDRLKVLFELASALRESRLPTLKSLRIAAFSETKDEGSFSKLLKGMNIKKYLLKEPTRRYNPEAGTTSHPTACRAFPPDNLEGSLRKPGVDKRIDAETPGKHSLKPTGDDTMVGVEIRRIKERLGPLYHTILIMFGLKELEDQQDLVAFEECLTAIGLAFV